MTGALRLNSRGPSTADPALKGAPRGQPGRDRLPARRQRLGKSTTMKTILGLVRPHTAPSSSMAGGSTGWPPARSSGAASRWCPRPPRLRPMTVLGDLAIGLRSSGARRRPRDRPGRRAGLRAVSATEGAGAAICRHLSGGEQQMLAIGRALMSRPRLLLMDEPSMGLSRPSSTRSSTSSRRSSPGHDDPGGRAERRRRAVDRQPRLCPAERQIAVATAPPPCSCRRHRRLISGRRAVSDILSILPQQLVFASRRHHLRVAGARLTMSTASSS